MPTRSKKKIYLEYRYHKEDPWKVYDWTQIEKYADSLDKNMRIEFPGAEYRKVPR